MQNKKSPLSKWNDLTIGITGSSGTLGKSLTKKLREKGAFVVGLTSKDISILEITNDSPNKWVNWKCGEEHMLDKYLSELNILILNHGINCQGSQSNIDINNSLEVNALSTWRLLERFELIAERESSKYKCREVWINTSEAEVQPALSPVYEISKRLIGQLISIKMIGLTQRSKSFIKIRKLVLGPFRSDLNPLGIMNADFVANQIIKLAELNLNLIIVSPNPISYFLVPCSELIRLIYSYLTNKYNNPDKGKE